MKNLTWKQWAAIGIILIIIVTAVICHFVQPQVTYTLFEIVTCVSFVLGTLTGYWIKKNDVVKV